MRARFVILCCLAVSRAAVAGEWALMPRLALVAGTSSSDDDLYNYFAAAPVFNFRYAGTTYGAPVLAADLANDTTSYFFETYREYLEGEGGLAQLVAVGGVSPHDVTYARNYFHLGAGDVWEVDGAPPAVAVELSRDWTASAYVVVAPYRAAPTAHDIESAANAAALAAYFNAPLFYADAGGLSPQALAAIEPLAPSKAIIVEIDDVLGPAVNDQLAGLGAQVVADLRSEAEVVSYINGATDPAAPVLCCFRGRDQAAPAALAAARYGGFVLEVPAGFAALAGDVRALIAAEVPPRREKLRAPFLLPAGVREGEQAVADQFYAWLEGLGGTDDRQLEYVLTFATEGDGGLSCVWDRAILGNPEVPAERGAAAGRFLNPLAANLASLSLTSSYRALVFANPRPGHVTFCGVAYMAQNVVSNADYFTDNYGARHKVNEVLGCRGGGYDDPGVFDDFDRNGYKPVVHDGRDAGPGYHPLVPGEPLIGFPEDVRRGTGFFYGSTHGSSGGIYPLGKDTGITANVDWGQLDWPGGPEGLVNFDGDLFSYNRWNDMCGNDAGLVAAFNACSVAEGQMNAVVTRHLGAASISSYFPVTFQGSGWFWISFVHRATASGYTLGEALGYATAQVSEIFPAHRGGVDDTIRYFLTGDPLMRYYQPTWSKPAPADPDYDYGGHNPGGAGALARDFKASRAGGEVVLTWRRANDRPLGGWNLYRAGAPAPGARGGGSMTRVNAHLIRGSSPYKYVDPRPAESGEDYYWLEAVEANGRLSSYGPVRAREPTVPYAFALGPNWPNPCRGGTSISVVMPRDGDARLTVFDLRGAVVRTLWDGPLAGGGHVLTWDCADDRGHPVPAGVYLYRLVAGKNSAARRLVVAR